MAETRNVKTSKSMDAALRALRALKPAEPAKREGVMDEASQAAYSSQVKAGLLRTFGVPAPDGLDRLILEAAVQALTPERCVDFIGDHFKLARLPPRIQSNSRIN